MNARLIKETRDLLVILIGTLLLIAVPFGVNGGSAAPFGVVAFGLGCLVLGGCAFGNEFQHRTLALLLSQPISRWALWRDKMLILGTSIALSLAALLVCRRLYGAAPDEATWPVLVLMALCAFCGAPYWTLVCRQALVGMVVAVGFPSVLLVASELIGMWLGKGEVAQPASAAVLLTLYCAIALWRGYERFKRLDVVDTAGRDLSLPTSLEAALARPLARVSSRFGGPYAALLKKELRLQQASFLVAGVFFFIAVIGFCTFLIYHPLGVGIVGDFATFMLVLPLIMGAVTVAEEKGWGVSEWHLTLPPSACQQWSAKMLVTLPTSVGLGLVLPAIMFLAGESLLPQEVPRAGIPPLSYLVPWVLVQLLLTSVAVYAGSFSKTTLRAIVTALGILVVGYCVSALTEPPAETISLRGIVIACLLRGRSPLFVVWASLLVLLGLIQWFAWQNFRSADRPPRLIIAQLLLLLFVAAMATSAIFVALQMAEQMVR